MNDILKNNFDKIPFDKYVLDCVKRMKAIGIIEDAYLRVFKQEEAGYIDGIAYRIEETFKDLKEFESSGRRELYEGYEKENIRHFKDGTICINSFCFIPKKNRDPINQSIFVDPRLYAVANLYPYILEKFPNYLKQLTSPKYYQYKMKGCAEYIELYSKEAAEIQVLWFERFFLKTPEERKDSIYNEKILAGLQDFT